MSANYSLRFTPLAAEDLEQAFAYIGLELLSPNAAAELMDEIEHKISQLAVFPYSGALVNDAGLSSRGYRRVVAKNFVAFYLVDKENEQIVIMRVLYGARDYMEFL